MTATLCPPPYFPRLRWRVIVCVLAGSLGACADVSQAPGDEPADDAAPGTPPENLTAFERQQRDAAEAAARQGRWLDAIWTWNIVLALSPNDADAKRQRAQAQHAIDAALPERLTRARAAHARGDIDTAARAYLDVLALAPDHAGAADALREIEHERVRRAHRAKPFSIVP
jgi:hypothetical protein